MVMQALTQYSDKIVELSLNENGLSQAEPLFIDLGQFKNLKRLSLALNFNKKMQGIGNSLIQLLGYWEDALVEIDSKLISTPDNQSLSSMHFTRITHLKNLISVVT